MLWLIVTPTSFVMNYSEKWVTQTFSDEIKEKDCVDC